MDAATAIIAARAGADILGFVFAPSRRRVEPETVREIREKLWLQNLPVKTAGVFVNSSQEEILQISAECQLDYLQLHGEESPAFCCKLNRPVIKAFRVSGPEIVSAAAAYPAEYLLFDTYSAGAHGGTGEVFDWRVLRDASEQLKVPFLLAGGLNSANIIEAVRIARPAGVDVSGGVETAGVKDPAKIIAFIQAARAADKEVGYA